MIDLHTHSIFSDGELIPAELVRRALVKGYTAIGITDHGDSSNIDFCIPRIVSIAAELNQVLAIRVIPGIEITHVPPQLIAMTVQRARQLGACLVVVHGETISEPVAPGTNRAALEADIDILAHPGLITPEETRLAAARSICLEITARRGHSLTNGHVATMATAAGAPMVIDTDTHSPDNLISREMALKVVQGAGLDPACFERMQGHARDLIQRRCNQ